MSLIFFTNSTWSQQRHTCNLISVLRTLRHLPHSKRTAHWSVIELWRFARTSIFARCCTLWLDTCCGFKRRSLVTGVRYSTVQRFMKPSIDATIPIVKCLRCHFFWRGHELPMARTQCNRRTCWSKHQAWSFSFSTACLTSFCVTFRICSWHPTRAFDVTPFQQKVRNCAYCIRFTV